MALKLWLKQGAKNANPNAITLSIKAAWPRKMRITAVKQAYTPNIYEIIEIIIEGQSQSQR